MTNLIAEQWLSLGRLGVYLANTANDLPRALRLYEWNAQVTSACLQDIGHLEVLIRNRYDQELSKGSPGWSSASDPLWTRQTGIKTTKELQAKSNTISKSSLTNARKKGVKVTHGHTVANLSFGFWTALTQAEREATIWTPILSPLFPGLSRGPIHNRMGTLNQFRNRLAHWEPVFSSTTRFMRQLEDVDNLYFALSPEVRMWVGERSTVMDLIRTVPEPLLSIPPTMYLGTRT